MRSPKLLTGGIESAEDFAQRFVQFMRRSEIPQQATLGEGLDIRDGLPIKWVGRGDKNRLAQPVKRHDAPTEAGVPRKTSRQFHIQVVAVDGDITETRFLDQEFK